MGGCVQTGCVISTMGGATRSAVAWGLMDKLLAIVLKDTDWEEMAKLVKVAANCCSFQLSTLLNVFFLYCLFDLRTVNLSRHQ